MDFLRQRSTKSLIDSNDSIPGKPGVVVEENVALKRRVGLLSGVALLVGTMIGSVFAFLFDFLLLLNSVLGSK